jgi:hypothetical protein
MKILLFGEYSGFFNNLKEGLLKLGHNVFLASEGDGYKNFPSDFSWKSKYDIGRLKHIIEIGKIFTHKKYFTGYDVVMLIGPSIFSRYKFVKKPVFDMLIRNNKKVFLSGCGIQAITMDYWFDRIKEKYHDYMAGYFIDNRPETLMYHNKNLSNWELELLDRIDGYIPIWYEYAQPFREHKKLVKTIRIPINVHKYEYKPNKVNGKIVFFHGLPSRSSCKGSNFINEAFSRMELKYSDVAEFIIAGGLPFNEYMKIINRTNVVIDDVNSYSVAMNGLIAMALGKIVMGGAEPLANIELGYQYNPIYNLTNDVDQICSCIEDVIRNKDEIETIGLLSRKFVEEYHDYSKIAKEYIEVFTRNRN